MKIAISGAGIAGLTAALYLHHQQHEVYVFEKAKSFKDQGYGLSVKTFGIDILKELGLFENLKTKGLAVSSFNLCRAGGDLIRKIPAAVIEQMTGGAIPVSRGGLHQVLYDAVADVIPVIFNKQIVGIDHLPEGESVSFEDGACQEFDLLVISEGLRSSTRKLLFGDEGWAPFDIAYMAAQINHSHNLTPGEAYSFRGIERNLSIFPINNRSVVIQAYFRDYVRPIMSKADKQLLLQETFSDFTLKVTEILNGFQPGDVVFYDTVAMVQLSKLYKRRVAFIGDAAHSTTFLSGMGASLGMLDGKLLASAISSTSNINIGLSRFNEKMLPVCKQFQRHARNAIKRELPQNAFQLWLSNGIVQFMPFSAMVKNVHSKLSVEERVLAQL